MRRIIALATGAVALLTASAAIAQPACTQLTITGHPSYPPIGYRDGDQIAGAGATMLAEIGAKLGIPVVPLYTGTWEEAQAATRDATADIIFGIYYNDERATYLDYVQPAFTTDPVVVFTQQGVGMNFVGRDDLIGKQGVTNIGESFGVELDAFIAESLDVARVDGVDAAFTELLAGRAEYVIFGLYPGEAVITEMGVRDQIAVLSPTLLEADMFVAFSKQSPCLSHIEAVGAEIETMQANGRIEELIAIANEAWQEAN